MEKAGVPIIRGYRGEDQSLEKLQSEAEKIGFVIMFFFYTFVSKIKCFYFELVSSN